MSSGDNVHDYVHILEDDASDAFDPPQPVHRRFGRPELRMRLQRLGNNTDHDYLAMDHDGEENAGTDDVLGEEEGNAEIVETRETLPSVSNAVEEPVLDNQNHAASSTSGSANNPPDSGPAAAHPFEILAVAAGLSTEAAAARILIDLTASSPSHFKKRKRHSLGTPKMKSSAASSGSGADDGDDEGLTCPICLDTWEMSGEHRLVSLRCGHLFGASCIRRWLNDSSRQSGNRVCPQCKTRASNKDIRPLYAKRLRAIDRSEEHTLREKLDAEKNQSQALRTELANLTMSHTMLKLKTQTLEADNERLKLLMRTGGGYSHAFDLSDDPKLLLQSYKLYMERNLEIAREPGCRVMSYAENHSALIVSQRSAQGLFPGFGLRFIDTPTFRPSNYLHASAKLLRDICLSADQQLLAVASMEPRVKLFDLRTRQVASIFTPTGDNKALWACAMDRNERENFLYLGAQHGSTFIYDVRFPETIVEEFKTEGDLSPVINIAPVPAGKNFPCGGFIVCKLQSLWFYEYTASSGSTNATRLNVDGPFISINYSAAQDTLLVSARSSATYPQSRYLLGRLEKVDTTPVFDVAVSFFGSKVTPVMTRCSQIAVESNTLIAGYIQDVKLLALFDARRKQRQQSLPVQELVYDTCPVYTSNSTYLAALTETKCRIYKLATSSSSS